MQYWHFVLTVIIVMSESLDATPQVPRVTQQFILGEHESDVHSLSFSPDGKFLASGGRDKLTILWDLGLRKKLVVHKSDDRVSSVQFSPDGKFIASGAEDGSISLWDSATHQKRMTLNAHTKKITCLAFSPDGKTLSSTAWEGIVRLWDPTSGKQVAALEGHGSWPYNAVFQAAFSLDGLRLATSGSDGRIVIWNTNTLTMISAFENGEPIGSLNFSKDSKSLAFTESVWRRDLAPAMASANHIKILDISSGKVVQELQGHTANVTKVVFFADDKFLASGSYDGTMRIWNMATGKEIQRIGCKHNGAILSIAVSKDGKGLAFGGADFTVHVLDVSK